VTVPQRSLFPFPRIQAKGIYPDATVVRGPDWEYGEQDGKNISSRDRQVHIAYGDH